MESIGIGPIRKKDDFSDYVSGSFDLPDSEKVTHQVRQMLGYVEHYDRVTWAIRTARGRVIVVMQQRHEADPERAAGQVELINSPFREGALKGMEEIVAGFHYLDQMIYRKARGI